MSYVECTQVTEIEHQEYSVQGIQFLALFLHEIDGGTHVGIAEEDGRFIVFSVENGELGYSLLDIWDDFESAHIGFMKLYERKRKQQS
jgi:hypothetical protein